MLPLTTDMTRTMVKRLVTNSVSTIEKARKPETIPKARALMFKEIISLWSTYLF